LLALFAAASRRPGVQVRAEGLPGRMETSEARSARARNRNSNWVRSCRSARSRLYAVAAGVLN
jgi:hypothetical protein